jgi:integrase
VKKILVRLGSLLADAQERGLVAQNVVRNLKARRRQGRDRQAEARVRGKLKVGIDIPTPAEIQALIAQLADPSFNHWRPLLLTAIFTGLRASELRALSWRDVDLKRGELHVRRRADRYNRIGPPKSEAGERTVPLPPLLLNTLKEHRLGSKHDLVFGNGRGNIENWGNIINRGFHPAQVAAGIIQAPGKAKYTRLARLETLLCFMVHQSPRRWRSRTTVEDCTDTPRTFIDHDDRGHLRSFVSAQRRRQ